MRSELIQPVLALGRSSTCWKQEAAAADVRHHRQRASPVAGDQRRIVDETLSHHLGRAVGHGCVLPQRQGHSPPSLALARRSSPSSLLAARLEVAAVLLCCSLVGAAERGTGRAGLRKAGVDDAMVAGSPSRAPHVRQQLGAGTRGRRGTAAESDQQARPCRCRWTPTACGLDGGVR